MKKRCLRVKTFGEVDLQDPKFQTHLIFEIVEMLRIESLHISKPQV
jgi:hypothetical protein